MTAPRIGSKRKRADLTRGIDPAVLRPDDPDGELYEMRRRAAGGQLPRRSCASTELGPC